ncbi:MAG: tocopherol cyclase family protein [Chitinophagales bacterium]
MSKLSAYTKAFFNHENYHGWFKKKKFFEGWYFKMVSADGNHAFAIIPGVAMDAKGNKQSFIQILDGKKFTAVYHKFLYEEFHPSAKRFKVSIGENSFSMNRLKLNLKEMKGKISFTEHAEWEKKLLAPGIMGWYSFVPFMECYHQVVSMHFNLLGRIIIDGQEVNFNGGRGYLEKDWGRSFPSSWIWMQSNHFGKDKTSFKLSVAKIPWIGTSFVGFICAFLQDGKIQKFATYTGAKLKHIEIEKNHVSVTLEDKKFILNVYATRPPGAELVSPILGLMDGRVHESMVSEITVQLREKQSGKTIFEDVGKHAGIEVAGNINELLEGYKK